MRPCCHAALSSGVAIPVRPAFLGNDTQVLAEIFQSGSAEELALQASHGITTSSRLPVIAPAMEPKLLRQIFAKGDARLTNRIQLTTDGHSIYLQAVEGALNGDVDFAQLVKLYGNDPEAEKRYSPATCIGCEREAVTGNPDPDHISTSYVERANLSMRMGMRPVHSAHQCLLEKDREPRRRRCALFHVLQFRRVHKTLRCSPPMAAGVDSRLWEIKDIVAMIEAHEKIKLIHCPRLRALTSMTATDSALHPAHGRSPSSVFRRS